MDLSYGWNGFVFDLTQARISTIVEFQEQNSDGDWDIRQAPISSGIDEDGDAEWEARDSVRYSAPFRSLSASASLVDSNSGAIYLGVPKDRKHNPENSNRLPQLLVTIEEVIGDDSPDIAKNGELFFNPGMPEMQLDDSVYLVLPVPGRVFDTINQAADSSTTKFSLYVHLKCWHTTGPHGDSYLYVDTDNPGQAEWIAITTSKIFDDLTGNQITATPKLAGDTSTSQGVDETSFDKLSKIETHIKIIRNAVVFACTGLFAWLIVAMNLPKN